MNSYPKAIGPYSIYFDCGKLIFVSGQLPVNPDTENIEHTDIKEQSKRSLENIKGVLDELNLSFKNVVKTTVFLADMQDFVAMNEVYASYFSEPYPARSCVSVKKLPKDALVEIEVIIKK